MQISRLVAEVGVKKEKRKDMKIEENFLKKHSPPRKPKIKKGILQKYLINNPMHSTRNNKKELYSLDVLNLDTKNQIQKQK